MTKIAPSILAADLSKINNEVITDEAKIIDMNNFDENNNLKVSHGKKQHVIVKII